LQRIGWTNINCVFENCKCSDKNHPGIAVIYVRIAYLNTACISAAERCFAWGLTIQEIQDMQDERTVFEEATEGQGEYPENRGENGAT
jgi:hypothetical protein